MKLSEIEQHYNGMDFDVLDKHLISLKQTIRNLPSGYVEECGLKIMATEAEYALKKKVEKALKKSDSNYYRDKLAELNEY